MKKTDFLKMSDTERTEFLEKAYQARKDRNMRPDELEVARVAAEKIAAGNRITVSEFECLTGIKFSHNMTGKMAGILSLSTNCLANPICLARLKSGVGICAECFAAAIQLQYDGVLENTTFNYKALNESILPLEVLPIIDAPEVRFESFGDVGSVNHAANYLNMARVNPLVAFTLWTKNPEFIHKAIQAGYSKPSNMTIILSSPLLNERVAIPERYAYFIDKTFTVYTLAWLDDHGHGTEFINCGGRSCKHCQRCYLGACASGSDIRELLKKDADKAAKQRGGNWKAWNDTEAANIPAPAKSDRAADIMRLFGK